MGSKDKLKAYVSNPYGFTEAGRYFMENKFLPRLNEIEGLKAIDAWEGVKEKKEQLEERYAPFKVRQKLYENNRERILDSDIMIAVLEGQEVDPGVAIEMGIARENEIPVFGYRSDRRRIGDDPWEKPGNLMVTAIALRTAPIADSLDQLVEEIRDYIKKKG